MLLADVQNPTKIKNIVEIFSLWMWIAETKRPGEGVGSMRTLADKGTGQKLAKSCGRLLCMTPLPLSLTLTGMYYFVVYTHMNFIQLVWGVWAVHSG